MRRQTIRLGVVGVALGGLLGAGLTAQAGPSSGTTLNVAITDKSLYLQGPTTFPAGQVSVTLENARSKGGAEFGLLRLASGYHWADFRSDLKTAFGNLFGPHGNKKKGLRALNHAINHITAYGGLEVNSPGSTGSGTLLVPSSGTYVVFDDSHQLPRHPHFVTATAPSGTQTLPTAGGNVVAMTNRRFSGDRTLPAKGTINFTNHSTESPHFLVLQHVKEGTTRKQVINSLQSNSNQKPSWVLKGEADAEILSLNSTENFHVNLPTGQYAEMCFFPDPKTGQPHALMGMVRMVHLK